MLARITEQKKGIQGGMPNEEVRRLLFLYLYIGYRMNLKQILILAESFNNICLPLGLNSIQQSLPLNCCRRLSGNIIDNTIDPAHLVYDSV